MKKNSFFLYILLFAFALSSCDIDAKLDEQGKSDTDDVNVIQEVGEQALDKVMIGEDSKNKDVPTTTQTSRSEVPLKQKQEVKEEDVETPQIDVSSYQESIPQEQTEPVVKKRIVDTTTKAS